MLYISADTRYTDGIVLRIGANPMEIKSKKDDSHDLQKCVEEWTKVSTPSVPKGNSWLKKLLDHSVTTVPLAVWLRGAKPLGPFLGPLTSFPSV